MQENIRKWFWAPHSFERYLRLCKRLVINRARFLFLAVLIVLCLSDNTRAVTLNVLSDAYWQVSSYVAATLALFYTVSVKLDRKDKLAAILGKSPVYQVGFASVLGGVPGCGGAIIVITQFVKGRLSFGSVVAVLTATMGDAAFLLLSADPSSGIFVLALSVMVGLLYGLLIDQLCGVDFMKPRAEQQNQNKNNIHPAHELSAAMQPEGRFWEAMLWPTMVIAVLGSFQVDLDGFFKFQEGTMTWIGATALFVAMFLWALGGDTEPSRLLDAPDSEKSGLPIFQRVAQETNFVTCWVVLSFLLFELGMLWAQTDLTLLFTEVPSLMVLLAVVVGLLPGCGPQIIVTTLFINGLIPMSAQLGNAISNDGDALFPAIVLAPKAAIVATLYTTLPALAVAYGFYTFFE
ncbi:MAG: hypothetical protein CMH56_07965 [Myxococcales bacterium]|nr:hypothetical protein [Myxococcales bacterium]|tara:strand:- start:3397 stop:4611 length:1215 start_codon:yes stop_codon:yes gene_type:complete